MPNVIKIKSNGTAGTAPTSLEVGELALNRADGQLYYRNTSNNIAAITDTIDGGTPAASAGLLLNCNGTNGSTTFTDSSPNGFTGTVVGNAQISTAQSKFGGASALFDGNGDRVEFSSNAAWAFGTGDFTVEVWAYFNSIPSPTGEDQFINVNASGGFSLYRTASFGGALTVSNRITNQFQQVWTPSANVWYHIAVCRASGTMRVFIDGVQLGSNVANSTNYAQGTLQFGGTTDGAQWSIDGYLDDLRIIKSALYTSAFTPPTAELTATPGATSRTQTIKLRGAPAATLSSVNPTPAAREPVYESDTRLLKVGDGTTAYNSLGYVRPQVTATDRLLGRSSAGAGVAEEITCTAFARTVLDDVDAAAVRTTVGAAATSHAHGNITSAGAIGSTANLPVITTTSGVLTTGSFGGTGATNFVAGNDQRLAKAWVNFDGTAAANLSGTWSQSGTATLTVNATAHGLIAGSVVWLDFTSGSAVDGLFTVATATTNSFTVTAPVLTGSGNVTLVRNSIRASVGVSSVSDNGLGDYTINFTSGTLSDANYAAVVTIGGTSSALMARTWEDSTARSASTLRIACVSVASGNPNIDPAQVSVVVFR